MHHKDDDVIISTGIPNGTGVEIRNHLIELQNIFGNVNQLADGAQYQVDLIKVRLDEVEDLVDEELQKKYPVRKTRNKKVGRNKIEVITSDGEVLTLLDVKKEHALARFRLLGSTD